MVRNSKKILKIHGLYVGLYKLIKVAGVEKAILIQRRLVEPAWIELWFLSTENQWDEGLWEQLSDENKDWFAYCYHITEQKENKWLEIALSKKFKKVQQRLVLLEGMIMAGNINKDLVDEINEILDNLAKSYQLPVKQATRTKNRIKRAWEQVATSYAS